MKWVLTVIRQDVLRDRLFEGAMNIVWSGIMKDASIKHIRDASIRVIVEMINSQKFLLAAGD